MKTHRLSHGPRAVILTILHVVFPPTLFSAETLAAAPSTAEPIPWSEIGERAGAQYQGDGLSIVPGERNALLRCAFQKLEGEATEEGLWLTSTVSDAVKDRFRVVAVSVGRSSGPRGNSAADVEESNLNPVAKSHPLASTGTVQVAEKLVRFIRPGLIEEYSVSIDGVRQDFIVERANPNAHPSILYPRKGELRVELEVTGAWVEAMAQGARLVLDGSGRKIAYSRLRVTDATGKELPARMEALQKSEVPNPKSEMGLAMLVNDTDAVYPIRIDPTFSDENWVSMGSIPGANGMVYAATVDDSGNLYIGGSFWIVGDVVANCIAKWNGSSWSAVGLGMNSTVYGLAAAGSDLYASGGFIRATNSGGVAVMVNRIAQWDGNNWSPLGSGMNNNVYALAVSGNNLYAGGAFTTAGEAAAGFIAKWNGNSWSALDSGMNGEVRALAVSESYLYAGGNFIMAGEVPANFVAKWDGSSWSALGSGMNSTVYALAAAGNDLYVGGAFTMAGDVPANFIAQWDGNSWSPLGSGMGHGVRALAVAGSDLYAGGAFATAGGVPVHCIAKWNGSTWSAVGSGMNASVLTLVVSGGDLYAGGLFYGAAGRVPANYIAKWNGNNWSALGSGMNHWVHTLAVSGSDLYAGGNFITTGGEAANYVAKWDGSNWSALGSGMNSNVHALAVAGSDLYAGGAFTTAGGVPANYIAKWNGSDWSALGSGMNSDVNALAVVGNDLYAGGAFTTAGGLPANCIAKWDGTSWAAMGSGMGYGVRALAVSGSDLYAGGGSAMLGRVTDRIAKWDGSNWSALGSGVDWGVRALAVSGSDLYAGGDSVVADGGRVTRIAKWNGSSWSSLGSGMSDLGTPQVYALTVFGSDLYAGGSFTTATNADGVAVTAARIAKWDGSRWSALGSGVNGAVLALAVLGRDLFAGGRFTTAGGKVSAYLAKAEIVSPANAVPPQFRDGADFVVRFDGSPGVTYTIEFTLDTAPAHWQKATNLTAPGTNQGLGVGVFEFRDNSAAAPRRFYRAVWPAY